MNILVECETESKRISPTGLTDFCIQAMLRSNMHEADARITAEVLVTTDTWGIYTHGTKHLRVYLSKLRAGGINAQAVPEVTSQGPAWAIVNGHQAMAMVTSCRAMKLAIEKARACGIGYVGVKNSTHFGAAGYYATMAARQDMIGLAMSNVDANMTVPGARVAVIGNNPLAYAVPAGQERPIFLDIATSSVAAGKIYAAQGQGKPVPDTWIVDDEGLPTADIRNYPHAGTLLPMAGHKGYGLAVLVEILSAVLTGAAFTKSVIGWAGHLAQPSDTGHAFLAIDVAAIMPLQTFKDRIDRMIREIKDAPRAKGAERIYLPGEMEWERRDEALRAGIPLPVDVMASLAGLAKDLDLNVDPWLERAAPAAAQNDQMMRFAEGGGSSLSPSSS
jgi:ureidoglycolate dehydrogenase (NAD+)